MINYDQKPHCYKCYWRNYFIDNKMAGTMFVNSENTQMYLIVAQEPATVNQDFYSIIDLQSNSILKQNMNLNDMLTFLCEHKCMTVYSETQVQYRYVLSYDNCVCSCDCDKK